MMRALFLTALLATQVTGSQGCSRVVTGVVSPFLGSGQVEAKALTER